MNQYLSAEKTGIEPMADYSGATTATAGLDILRTLLEPEHTTTHRGHLDQISPAAQRQLLVELDALEAVIGTFNAPA